MPMHEQVRQYYAWEAIRPYNHNGKVSTKPNPFDLDKTVFCLETKLGDNFDYDYGTEEVILAKKCERYSEYEKNRSKYIADKKRAELEQEKREQAKEDALDRLNEKSCN